MIDEVEHLLDPVVFAHWSTRWFNCLTIMVVRWHCSRPFGSICSLKLDLDLIPLC